MHRVDDSQWPVLKIAILDYYTMEDAEAFINTMESAFARDEPFVVIMETNHTDNDKRDKGVNRYQTQWMKANRPNIKKYVRGMASVSPHASMLALWKTVVRLTGPRMYGCPSDMFLSMDEAETWVRGQLAKR